MAPKGKKAESAPSKAMSMKSNKSGASNKRTAAQAQLQHDEEQAWVTE